MTILTLQPADGVGNNTTLLSISPTANQSTQPQLRVGEANDASNDFRWALIRFDISSIPSGATINSVTFSVWIFGDLSSNARNWSLYRILRNWVTAEATWNVYSSGNNWGTAGCSDAATDYDGVFGAWATTAFSATEPVGTKKSFIVDTTEFKKWVDGTYNSYGWLIRTTVGRSVVNDQYLVDSSYGTTASERPELVVDYTSGGQQFRIILNS